MFSAANKRRAMTAGLAGMITLASYAVYAVTVVPFLEKASPETARDGGDFVPSPKPDSLGPIDDRFRQWFPEADSWEHQNPVMIETPQAIVLFRTYKSSRGGIVRLNPCSVVMLSGDSDAPPAQRIREALVLRAPEGADLKFDKEFDLKQGNIGKLIGGDLKGPVTIRGAGKLPTPDDDLFLSTRDISMHGDVITTVEDVDFRWGANHGHGRNLNIALLPEADGQREASRFGGLAALELREDVLLHLVLSEEEQPGEANATPAPRPTPADNSDNPFPFTKDTPLDIFCGGAFRFDFIQLEASFNDVVHAERALPNGERDTLQCKKLVIGFREMVEGAPANEESKRAFARMEVKRLEALGEPAVLNAPSRESYAQGNKLAYDFLTGAVNLESPTEAQFRQASNEIRTRVLQYEPGEDNRIGRFLADGPGWLDWEMRGENSRPSRRFRASWSTRLHSLPNEGLQIISVEGDAVINVTEMGRIAAAQIHAWVEEKFPPAAGPLPNGEKPKPELIPKRMLAVQGVTFQSDQLTGRTERLEAWFLDSNGGNAGPVAGTSAVMHTVGFRGLPQQPERVQVVRFQSPRQVPWQSSGASGNTAQGNTPRDFGPQHPPASAMAGDGLMGHTAVNRLPWGNASPTAEEQTGTVPMVPVIPRGSQPGRGNQPGGQNPNIQPGNLSPLAASGRQFDVNGDMIQLQLIQREKTADLTQVTIHGAAVLKETRTENPDDLPLLVKGDVLHVENAHLPTSVVTVAGAPAHIEGRGLGLTANRINLDRGRNRLWIDEPGLMTLLIDRDLQGQKLREPMPLEITWRNKFEFDGIRATFDRGVVARREQEQLQTELLEVIMSERVDFGQTTSPNPRRTDQRPEIAQVICREGVYLEAQRYDNHGELEAIEKMQMVDLSIDQQSGALSGGGPGWIHRVGKSDAKSDFSLPGNVRPPATGPVRRDEESKLVYLRVDFQQGMTGNIHRKQVIFQHQVVCIYGEIARWDETIDGDRPSEFGPKTVRLRSDQLQVTEMPALNGAPAWRELVASGNTTAEGKQFTANADKITYTENQQILGMEGDSVRPAEFFLQKNPGDRPARFAARKVKYNRKTGEYTLDGADSLDLTVPRSGAGGRGGR